MVLLGTDGVWDNLFDKRTLEIVTAWQQRKLPKRGTAQSLADEIARSASAISLSKDTVTPFEVASGRRWRGGKLDDITVVAAVIGAAPAQVNVPLGTDAELDAFLKNIGATATPAVKSKL